MRKPIIVVAALMAVVVGYFAVGKLLRSKPSGVLVEMPILIHRSQPMNGNANCLQGVDDYIPTQLVVIRSPRVLQRALDRLKATDVKSFEGLANPMGQLSSKLSVTRDRALEGAPNCIVIVGFRGQNVAECEVVLKTIVDSYQEELDEIFDDRNIMTRKELTKRIEKLRVELKAINDEHRAFRRKNLQPNKERGEVRVRMLDQKLVETKFAREEARTRLRAAEKSSDSPRVVAQAKDWAKQSGADAPQAKLVEAYVEHLKWKIEDLGETQENVEQLIDAEVRLAMRFADIELEENDFRRLREFHQQFLDAAMKQLQELELLNYSNATGKISVHVLAQPEVRP